MNKTFGAEDQFRTGLGVTNLMNDARESVYKSYEADDQYFQRLKIGTQVNLKFSYNF
jgi:hypothetical protein